MYRRRSARPVSQCGRFNRCEDFAPFGVVRGGKSFCGGQCETCLSVQQRLPFGIGTSSPIR